MIGVCFRLSVLFAPKTASPRLNEMMILFMSQVSVWFFFGEGEDSSYIHTIWYTSRYIRDTVHGRNPKQPPEMVLKPYME